MKKIFSTRMRFITTLATCFVMIATVTTSISSLFFWGEPECPDSLRKN